MREDLRCTIHTNLRLLSGSEIFKTTSEENVVLLLRVVELVSLAPVVGHSVGEDVAVLVECALGDGLLARVARLELGPGVLVPEGVPPVTADRGQGAMHRVEGDVVHREDVLKYNPPARYSLPCGPLTWKPLTAPLLR